MSYAEKVQRDYLKGKENEIKLLPVLKELFKDDTLEIVQEKYSPFDYTGNNKRIELKTRFNTKYTFQTTMLPVNKMRDARRYVRRYEGDYYFIFSFTDVNCYIKFNKKKFKKFDRGMWGRTDRNLTELDEYVFIPVSELINF